MKSIPVRPGDFAVNSKPGPEGLPLPCVNDIGRGLDVIGAPFATRNSLLEKLFTIEERIYPNDEDTPAEYAELANAYAQCQRHFGKDTWGLLDIYPLVGGRSDHHSWRGSNLTEVQRSIMGDVKVQGEYAGFSGQVSAMSRSQYASSAATYFVNIYGFFPKYSLRLMPQKSLRDTLKPEVREMIDTYEAKRLKTEFFTRFGGYFLKYAVIGGLCNYTATRSTASTMTDKGFSSSAEASYQYGKGSGSVEQEESHSELVNNAEWDMYAQGGNGTIDFADPKSFRRWTESVEKNPELIHFETVNGEPGCAPVWDLAETDARRKEIREAFLEYAIERQTTYEFYDPDLVQLYAFFDSKTDPKLKRWCYSTKKSDKPDGNWVVKKHGMHVYKSSRPGCSKFTSCRKTEKQGAFKKDVDVHKIVQGNTPSGWTKICTFYAPEKPLKATMDRWSPINKYKRKINGDLCGFHYRDHVEGAWSKVENAIFYAVVK